MTRNGKKFLSILIVMVGFSLSGYSNSANHPNKSIQFVNQKITLTNTVSTPDTIFYIGEDYINLVFNFKDEQVGHGPVELPPPGDIACIKPGCPGIRCSTTRCKCSDNDTTCGCITNE